MGKPMATAYSSLLVTPMPALPIAMRGSTLEMSRTDRVQSGAGQNGFSVLSLFYCHVLTSFSWGDGCKFVGTFHRGAQTGPGELTTLKGDVIKGSWLNGRANGSMILTMAGGDVFEGQFENGTVLHVRSCCFPSQTRFLHRRYGARQWKLLIRLRRHVARRMEEWPSLEDGNFDVPFIRQPSEPACDMGSSWKVRATRGCFHPAAHSQLYFSTNTCRRCCCHPSWHQLSS